MMSPTVSIERVATIFRHLLVFVSLCLLATHTTSILHAEVGSRVSVERVGDHVYDHNWSYVVTHGMGGCRHGDRFEDLAAEIKKAYPKSIVYTIKWDKDSRLGFGGVPVPWFVAAKIDEVGDAAAAELLRFKVDPSHLTLIGESFGNFVNYRIAKRMGCVARMLVLNPASELGGYRVANFREYCEQTWSFHSESPFDTQLRLGHRKILFHSWQDALPDELHTYGVRWLRQTLAGGDRKWLQMQKAFPTPVADGYDATISKDDSKEPLLVGA